MSWSGQRYSTAFVRNAIQKDSSDMGVLDSFLFVFGANSQMLALPWSAI
ncbi:hypothetical protein [Vreelandella stevensii]